MYGMTFDTPVVAFDYDWTISRDPEFFLQQMMAYEQRGWQAIVVTYRHDYEHPEDLQFLIDKGYKVFFTGRLAKKNFMENKHYNVELWIDDSPETIVMNMDGLTGKMFVPGHNNLYDL